MFSKLNLMIRLKFRCYVWFWPQSSKCEAAENISRAAVDVFLSWQSQILEISSLKKKQKKPLSIWRIHHPDDLSVHPSTELVDSEKNQSDTGIDFLDVLRKLDVFYVYSQASIHVSESVMSVTSQANLNAATSLCIWLIDGFSSLSVFFPPVQVNRFILAIAHIPHWVALHHSEMNSNHLFSKMH